MQNKSTVFIVVSKLVHKAIGSFIYPTVLWY